ncbi:MAG: response regulator [Betaproteobacteria bacterium]|nr:response regulator [Betaproteobacteria bacterium]
MADDPVNKPAIMIVEDDDDMAQLMRRILEQDGWAVHRAADGKEAKELIGRIAPPALVTLDIFLPDSTGVELILHVKDTPGWEQVPIIMVTAKPKDDDVNWAIKSGAKAYLLKPIKPDEYRDYVRRYARKPATG